MTLRRSTIEAHLNFYEVHMSLQRYNADKNTNTTDATGILCVHLRTLPNNVEHKLHIHPSTGVR